MATNVIMPALGIAQETGRIVQWLKTEGQQVSKGESLLEIETDKATVEIEAPATGLLANISAANGAEVPVGQVIALIMSTDEFAARRSTVAPSAPTVERSGPRTALAASNSGGRNAVPASSLAARIAAEHHLDLNQITPAGKRIQKADVMTYLQNQQNQQNQQKEVVSSNRARLIMASPKARRLASERNLHLEGIQGSGPGGAIIAADVLATLPETPDVAATQMDGTQPSAETTPTMSNIWRIMAQRTTQSWTSVPHFWLVREVNAARLIAWRTHVQKRTSEKITYSDLLVKIVAGVLRNHPHLNASWRDGTIISHDQINIGLAVAVEQGLIVPVIHQADTRALHEIAQRRQEVVARAQTGKLRPEDLEGGTFTISNLGMFGVDAFNAIINAPQAAILAVGRIAERVVPVNGQPGVQPMMTLTLSCDHRVADGAHGARFIAELADLIEEPLGLLD
jgi:pyruvate dehydrogenase E2 component (dihydrolipoamide acetyltransferase)